MKDRNAFAVIGALSLGLLGFIVWLTYFHHPEGEAPAWALLLAHLNAACNVSSAFCLLTGYRLIRAGRREEHKKRMLWAVGFTVGFLLSYTLQHHFVGDTKFGGEGALKALYLVILGSHILLSMAITPFVMTLLFFALTDKLEQHKALARRVYPFWLYVSVTGVLVYLFLTPYR